MWWCMEYRRYNWLFKQHWNYNQRRNIQISFRLWYIQRQCKSELFITGWRKENRGKCHFCRVYITHSHRSSSRINFTKATRSKRLDSFYYVLNLNSISIQSAKLIFIISKQINSSNCINFLKCINNRIVWAK